MLEFFCLNSIFSSVESLLIQNSHLLPNQIIYCTWIHGQVGEVGGCWHQLTLPKIVCCSSRCSNDRIWHRHLCNCLQISHGLKEQVLEETVREFARKAFSCSLSNHGKDDILMEPSLLPSKNSRAARCIKPTFRRNEIMNKIPKHFSNETERGS